MKACGICGRMYPDKKRFKETWAVGMFGGKTMVGPCCYRLRRKNAHTFRARKNKMRKMEKRWDREWRNHQ